jgi:hypothetical protein
MSTINLAVRQELGLISFVASGIGGIMYYVPCKINKAVHLESLRLVCPRTVFSFVTVITVTVTVSSRFAQSDKRKFIMAPLFGKNHFKLCDDDEERTESSFPRFCSLLKPNTRSRSQYKLASDDSMARFDRGFFFAVDESGGDDSMIHQLSTMDHQLPVLIGNTSGLASQGGAVASPDTVCRGAEACITENSMDSMFPLPVISTSSQNGQCIHPTEALNAGSFVHPKNASPGPFALEEGLTEAEDIDGSERYQSALTMTAYFEEEAEDLLSQGSIRSRPHLKHETPIPAVSEGVISSDSVKHDGVMELLNLIENLESSRSRRSLPSSRVRSVSVKDGDPSLRTGRRTGLNISNCAKSPSSSRSTSTNDFLEPSGVPRKESRRRRSSGRSISTRKSCSSCDNDCPSLSEVSRRSSRALESSTQQTRLSGASERDSKRREREGSRRSSRSIKDKEEPLIISVLPVNVKKTKLRQLPSTECVDESEQKETTRRDSKSTGDIKEKTTSPVSSCIKFSSSIDEFSLSTSEKKATPLITKDFIKSQSRTAPMTSLQEAAKLHPMVVISGRVPHTFVPKRLGQTHRNIPSMMDSSDHTNYTKAANNWNWEEDAWMSNPKRDVVLDEQEEEDETIFGSPTIHSRRTFGCDVLEGNDCLVHSIDSTKKVFYPSSGDRSPCCMPLDDMAYISPGFGPVRIRRTPTLKLRHPAQSVTMKPKSCREIKITGVDITSPLSVGTKEACVLVNSSRGKRRTSGSSRNERRGVPSSSRSVSLERTDDWTLNYL